MYTIAYRVCKPARQQRLTRLAHILFFSLLTALLPLSSTAQVLQLGGEWPDSEGRHVNAHGGCVLRAGDRYYWFGEERPVKGEKYQQGVTCYSSTDLCNWRYEGLALRVDDHSKAPLDAGCTIERPKVVYCSKTGQYVLWFHLELKGKGYAAAQCAVAVSKNVTTLPTAAGRKGERRILSDGYDKEGTTDHLLRRQPEGVVDATMV